MAEEPKDLVDRTCRFATDVRAFVDRLPGSLSDREDARQVVRASGSVAANYSEAQDGTRRRESGFRIKVCRKESRESWLWLRLVDVGGDAELAGEHGIKGPR